MENKNQMRAIPMLSLIGAEKAMDTYIKAFGAVETSRTMCPVRHVLAHGSLKIGETELMLGEHDPNMKDKNGEACVNSAGQQLFIYVPDADAAVKKAVAAGLKETQAPEDMFWGDRMGTVKDAFGMRWNVATHIRDVSKEEMEEAMKKMSEAAKSKAA
ncbi:MAG: VOC family protein [bacterium]|nr:VOC family protein [bacterium]